MNLRLLRSFLIAAALVLMMSPLHADVLLPGDTNVSPDVFPDPGNPPLLGHLHGNFDFGSGLLTGTWDEFVLVDPLGATCSGCLDFAFQVTVDPDLSDAIFAMTLGRFFGYTTDVGYVDGSGDIAPNSVSRGPFGGGVSFIFNTRASVLIPGHPSNFLVVATNATTYDTNGVLSISGGGNNHSVAGKINGLFEPTFVPEPGTVVLLGLGLAAVAAFRKRTT